MSKILSKKNPASGWVWRLRVNGAGFKMETSDDFIVVKGDQENDPDFVVHRETYDQPLEGPTFILFFCTST